jgi:hypothetical protein
MTVAMIYGFGVSIITYVHAVVTKTTIRMSGNVVYDFFMGATLNPRLGSVDLKMWAEVRVPWVIVFYLAVSGACKQYDTLGYVTPVSDFHEILPRRCLIPLIEYAFHVSCYWSLYERLVCPV